MILNKTEGGEAVCKRALRSMTSMKHCRFKYSDHLLRGEVAHELRITDSVLLLHRGEFILNGKMAVICTISTFYTYKHARTYTNSDRKDLINRTARSTAAKALNKRKYTKPVKPTPPLENITSHHTIQYIRREPNKEKILDNTKRHKT